MTVMPSDRPIRVALPRGDLRVPLAERLRAVGFIAVGYGKGSRAYRFPVEGIPHVVVRVFSEQDIPIQVALGQYDLGITRRAWIDELLVRYQHDSIVPLRPLDLGGQRLVLAGVAGVTLEALAARGPVRIATEYPHLTARYLNRARVPNYRLYEVWGTPQAWPPDDADLAAVTMLEDGPDVLATEGLHSLATLHDGPAWLIANREALSGRDLTTVLAPLLSLAMGAVAGGPTEPTVLAVRRVQSRPDANVRETFRIAVPDGHAQGHTVAALADAGIRFEGYDNGSTIRRPTGDRAGVEVKVMRPQDMPRAVALGLYDLALTGRDWLAAHAAAYPVAPVVELADLRRSRYELGAVVPEALPVTSIAEAVAYWRRDDPSRPIRVASEYAALADRYARERHLGRYRVIPISGASEGFVPEDADILIEGTETGTTLRANALRMIDVIMVSTNCAIGHIERPTGWRGTVRDELVARLQAAADATSSGGG